MASRTKAKTTTDKLYNGFVADLTERFQARFKQIQAIHNFHNGPEFEIALCEILRGVLPGRCGVCRGYVVGQGGQLAGDDIIIYDAARFPTLRALGQDLTLLEQVPAEAVLAYIEAKHTLYLDDAPKHAGQHLAKALQQVSAVKSVPRAQVPLSQMAGYEFGMWAAPLPGFPPLRNPWFAMVFARNIGPRKNANAEAIAFHMERLKDSVAHLPDVIVAGDVLGVPAILQRSPTPTIGLGPFLCGLTELVFLNSPGTALAAGMFQLLWALEHIELGPLPWSKMVIEALGGDGGRHVLWTPGESTPIRSKT